MSGKVLVYMQAFNSEKTIRKAVDSVLCQTYSNFILLVCDNGSTDGTAALVRKYQEKDGRIRPLFIKKNSLTTILDKSIPLFLEQYADICDYFCSVDADDEILPTFLEKSVAYTEEQDLDICVVGSMFTDAQTHIVHMRRTLPQNLVIEGAGFDALFPVYHQFTRTLWAKLYRTSIIRKTDYMKARRSFYGYDTVFVQEAFLKSKRVGVFSECLHIWYTNQRTSATYLYDDTRILADSINFDVALDYLLLKTGRVTTKNRDFLYIVYQNALRDTLKRILESKKSFREKVGDIYIMISNHYSKCLFIQDPGKDLVQQITTYLYSQNLFADEGILDKAAEILAILGQCSVPAQCSDPEKRFLMLLAIKRYWYERENAVNVSQQILSLAAGVPCLKDLELGCLVFARDIVRKILCGKDAEALGEAAALFTSGEDIPDGYVMPLVLLGLDLAARLEDQGQFVLFTKLQIQVLLQQGKKEEAAGVLDDWDELMPEDEDFQEFRRRVSEV